MKNKQIIKTTSWSAGPGCHGGCGVLAHIEDGRFVKIEGDPDHPWNQGRLCARALAMTQYVYHEDRLTRPLKRVGKRGEAHFEEITWEEAFDTIEARMNEIKAESGPESMIFSMGTGRDIGPWICMLAYAFGSPNVMFALSGNACYSPRIAALDTIQGDFCVFDAGQWLEGRYDHPEYQVPECMIIWGYNISATCPDNLFGHWIIDLMKKGTKIICVDPRLSFFASRSKHWLQIRPGTDAALAMGMLYVIINEGLYDHDFLETYTDAPRLVRKDTGQLLRHSDVDPVGNPENFVVIDRQTEKTAIWDTGDQEFFPAATIPALSGNFNIELLDGSCVECITAWDAFLESVAPYTPEAVEKITMIPAREMALAARLYASSKPAAIHWGVPIDMTPEITPLCHAIAALWALTGNLDVPGGNVFTRPAFNAVAYALPGAEGVIKLKNQDQDKPRIGREEYGPFDHFIWRCQTDKVLDQIFSEDPYPVKGLWMQTCNPLSGIGLDPELWQKALEKLDFIVGVDLFMTPSLRYADIILPAATFLEKEGVRSWWVPLQSINETCRVDQCRSDLEINFELARRFDPDLKWETIHGLFDDIVRPSGMSFKELQARGWALPPENHPSRPYRRHEKGLLRQDGKPGFATPSGKFELYSTLRENWGLPALPYHKEPPFTPVSRPDLAKDYPLILSTGRRSPAFFHSEHRNIPWLRQLDPDPVVEIHPETAARHGIGSGEWVVVENWMGHARFKAKVTKIVPPWMVMAAHGWWFPEKKDDPLFDTFSSNINVLIPMNEQGDDGLGAPIKHLMCRIRKETQKGEQ
ncbi:MAG: dimethylsulfide dehydrogenase [Desulfobacteraceae bacterium]|nr:MAG: dimethylsulfide dehydrogenase [Desulfobacteraceae bacterium]